MEQPPAVGAVVIGDSSAEADSSAKAPPKWGSIEEVVNAPLVNVRQYEWWISVIFTWIFLPLYLLSVSPVLCFSCVLVQVNIGLCTCTGQIFALSALGAQECNYNLLMAPFLWRQTFAKLFAFIKNSKTRLKLFYFEWAAFGLGKHFFSGEGIWTPGYAEVDSIVRGVQQRKSAFACVTAPVPDMFPSNIVVFLPNTSAPGGTTPSGSEWAAIRFAFHQAVFANVPERTPQIPGKIAEAWPDLKLADLNDAALLGRVVTKCVFYALFGLWLDDADSDVLSQWVTVAKFTIFPRALQRFLFNLLIKKAKKLRVETVRIIEKLNLQQIFVDANESLPEKYKRPTVVKLCDEMMYILCFAGMNGTTACATSCVAFLQCTHPDESWVEKIDFGRYSTPELMLEAYNKDPVKYIKETCRLDPPVTSATTSTAEIGNYELAGRNIMLKAGTLQQYVLSLAMRDEAVFADPTMFDPSRPEIDKIISWNGAFSSRDDAGLGGADEQAYPRICPGRWLAIDVVTAILNHATRPNQ